MLVFTDETCWEKLRSLMTISMLAYDSYKQHKLTQDRGLLASQMALAWAVLLHGGCRRCRECLALTGFTPDFVGTM